MDDNPTPEEMRSAAAEELEALEAEDSGTYEFDGGAEAAPETEPEPAAEEPEAPAEETPATSDAMADLNKRLGRTPETAPEMPADDDVEGWKKLAMAKLDQSSGLTTALQKERAEMRARNERTEHRLAQIMEAVAPAEAAPEEPGIPEVEEDIVGHLVGKMSEVVDQKIAPVLNQQQQAQQQQFISGQYQQLQETASADRQRLEGMGLDVEAAEQHLITSLHSSNVTNLRMRGATEEDAERASREMLQQLAGQRMVHAHQTGQSYWEGILQFATELGWRQADAAAPGELESVRQNLQQNEPAPAPSTQKLPGISRSEIDNMDDDQFAMALEKLRKQKGKQAADLEMTRMMLG